LGPNKLELMEAIRRRRTVRRYKADPVPEDKINHVLEAARLAPSYYNEQSWRFIVITQEQIKEKVLRCISALSRLTFNPAPPVLIVGCADPKKSAIKGDQEYYLVEMGIAMEHLMLAATELGLGTAWMCAFDENTVKQILGVPENVRVVALTPLGYPAEKKEEVKERKPLKEIVCKECWL